MSINNLWVIEYSPTQKAYHKHTVLDMVTKNLNTIIKNIIPGYIPIGIFETEDEADDFIKDAKQIIKR